MFFTRFKINEQRDKGTSMGVSPARVLFHLQGVQRRILFLIGS